MFVGSTFHLSSRDSSLDALSVLPRKFSHLSFMLSQNLFCGHAFEVDEACPYSFILFYSSFTLAVEICYCVQPVVNYIKLAQ
jgi:hypothetical protein